MPNKRGKSEDFPRNFSTKWYNKIPATYMSKNFYQKDPYNPKKDIFQKLILTKNGRELTLAGPAQIQAQLTLSLLVPAFLSQSYWQYRIQRAENGVK